MMTSQHSIVRNYFSDWLNAWNRFWFERSDPIVLSLVRVFAGAMILYTHFAWSFELNTFFGSQSIIPETYRGQLTGGLDLFWSHFDWMPSLLLWPSHVIVLIVMALFMVGFQTRITGIATAFFVISYANRATGAQFGLDQINAFLALYLALGPSGEYISVDRWLKKRAGQGGVTPSVMATISIRLIQIHMCVVYFFAGTGKLLGETWWDGTAIWGAIANLEYQTLDLTGLASHMAIVNIITYTTLFWEVSYPFLIWPRLTRPIWIAMALLVHFGIGFAMGMMTFGLVMVIGNLAFVTPRFIHGLTDRSRA
jgi:Vitamin K-dependent gamma-carboxylase